jgi:hypothetical protein
MKPVRNLSDTDLQLYLAGALPPGKQALLTAALAVDADLKARLEALRSDNREFEAKEMARLRARLFPAAATTAAPAGTARNATPAEPDGKAPLAAARSAAPARRPVADREDSLWNRLFPRGGRSFGYALAGSFAVLALCAVPFLGQRTEVSTWDDDPEYTVKGSALGVTLYVKGDSAYRVADHKAQVAPTDTLQAIPLGAQAQHLALFGWDPAQGLVRLFPTEGKDARRVSATEPPPALLLQGMEENRLVCVTANSPFRLADAEALLRKKPFTPLSGAPATHLARGLYVQVFSIAKSRGGRI